MTALRNHVKSAAAKVAMLSPQARFDRGILVLSHMRSATTAVTNVLSSHPSIFGYGETHVSYVDPNAPGRVIVNLALRRAYRARGQFFTDKILHNRLDNNVPKQFFESYGLFLARLPAPAIQSITRLASKTKMEGMEDPSAAALYYAQRLERLAELWDQFPDKRRLGFQAENLLADPDGSIDTIGSWIGLTPKLENRYVAHAATQRGGGGDPTRSAKLNRIEKSAPPVETVPFDPRIPKNLIARCETAHLALVNRF